MDDFISFFRRFSYKNITSSIFFKILYNPSQLLSSFYVFPFLRWRLNNHSFRSYSKFFLFTSRLYQAFILQEFISPFAPLWFYEFYLTFCKYRFICVRYFFPSNQANNPEYEPTVFLNSYQLAFLLETIYLSLNPVAAILKFLSENAFTETIHHYQRKSVSPWKFWKKTIRYPFVFIRKAFPSYKCASHSSFILLGFSCRLKLAYMFCINFVLSFYASISNAFQIFYLLQSVLPLNYHVLPLKYLLLSLKE